MTANKLKLYVLAALAAAAIPFPVAAQYDQDINVEGKYVPEYIGHDRIGLFPKPMKFDTAKSELDYSLTGVNADFAPRIVPLQATGWNTTRAYSRHRGYLDLGMGSWLNSTLSAGYRFVDNSTTAAGIRLQHNSTSLWKPENALPDTKRYRYDESLGIYASHLFEGAGRLDAAVDYHLGVFNYYGYNGGPNATGLTSGLTAPTQTLNDIAARVAWHSPAVRDDLEWYAGASVRYFGYRAGYAFPFLDASAAGTFRKPESVKGSRETTASLQAGILFPTSGKSAIGLDVDGTLVAYAGREESIADYFAFPSPINNYGMVSFTPYYRFNRSGIDIRIGAQVDLSIKAGPENDRYSTFHIAPAVKLDYNAGPVALYLHALGGSSLNTLAANYEYDYYQNPILYTTRPVYSPLDARLGLTFGPFSGFHAGLDVAWRSSRGLQSGGWYLPWLNFCQFDGHVIGLPSQIEGQNVVYDFSPDVRLDLKGFSVGLNLGYDAGRWFSINAEGRYQRQHGETGYFNGYDRPEWTADVTAESNPWGRLRFKLNYSLRAMRMMAAPAALSGTYSSGPDFFVDYRLPNTSMLGFGASYGITDNFDIWIQGDNLLNRKNGLLPGLGEPGIALSAGIGVRF